MFHTPAIGRGVNIKDIQVGAQREKYGTPSRKKELLWCMSGVISIENKICHRFYINFFICSEITS